MIFALFCFFGVLQETMMDNALRTISYIADIGNIVVLMARRRMPRTASQDCIETTPGAPEAKKQYKMICHVFESEDVSVFFNKRKNKQTKQTKHQHIQIWNLPVPKQTENSKKGAVCETIFTNQWVMTPPIFICSQWFMRQLQKHFLLSHCVAERSSAERK